jgi:hypothetical protein
MKIAWKLIVLVLLAVSVTVGAAIIFGMSQGDRGSPVIDARPLAVKGSVSTDSGPASIDPGKVEMLYFHRTDRCQSCNNAEQYTRDTLDKYYAGEMQSGRLSFQSIDYQQDKAMAEKYNVKVQGLKIKTTQGGQANIEDVPEIWSYVSDRDAFMGFLKSILDRELGK